MGYVRSRWAKLITVCTVAPVAQDTQPLTLRRPASSMGTPSQWPRHTQPVAQAHRVSDPGTPSQWHRHTQSVTQTHPASGTNTPSQCRGPSKRWPKFSCIKSPSSRTGAVWVPLVVEGFRQCGPRARHHYGAGHGRMRAA